MFRQLVFEFTAERELGLRVERFDASRKRRPRWEQGQRSSSRGWQ